MPHSLRCKLGNLKYKKMLTDREYERLCKALDIADKFKDVEAEVTEEHNKLYNADTLDEWQQGEHYAYHRVLQMIADMRCEE